MTDRTDLDEMISYYRARAAEYDQWFYRQGRYDRGSHANACWATEAAQVAAALDAFNLGGHILELACGTGIWTRQLVKRAGAITAVDASPEMIEINRRQVASDRVSYVQADLFDWQPPAQFNGVFFGFWLSHVPAERLDAFWRMIAAALRPGGKLFFVDSRASETSSAIDHELPRAGQLHVRKLNDGRQFKIVKVFHLPRDIEQAAAAAGLTVEVRQTAEYFLFGCGRLPGT
jgi:ubiquinone/menaquinone biosynthesis C-methylase UbiE